jgi:cephalosporin hydroxylase
MDKTKKFEAEREQRIKALGRLDEYARLGTDFVNKTASHKYSYNFSWLGRPIIQFPQDMIAMQEIIWDIRPDLVIETGIAHGGSLIYYASILEMAGKGRVIGIDIDIRAHNRAEIEKHNMYPRITMIEGSSTSAEVLAMVEKEASSCETVLVALDSNHTHDHVLEELNAYSKFVTPGSYLVVFDTVIEYMDEEHLKNRPWSKGNNPLTAVRQFLEDNSHFQTDSSITDKLLITVAPGGYLKRIS